MLPQAGDRGLGVEESSGEGLSQTGNLEPDHEGPSISCQEVWIFPNTKAEELHYHQACPTRNAKEILLKESKRKLITP